MLIIPTVSHIFVRYFEYRNDDVCPDYKSVYIATIWTKKEKLTDKQKVNNKTTSRELIYVLYLTCLSK
jgi:hypothetical protein